MSTLNLNNVLVDNYFALLKNLSVENKEALIARLANSLKKETAPPAKPILSAQDDFIAELTAEELIKDLRESRTSNRNRAEL